MKKNFILFIILILIFSYSCDKIINNTDNLFEDYEKKIDYSGNIKIYFTNPVKNTEMEKDLIDIINNQSPNDYLDLCIYGLNRENIVRAIENAIHKGVHVRFIGDMDGDRALSENGEYYNYYSRIAKALDASFPVKNKKRTNFPEDKGFNDFALINKKGIMHNKFMLLTDKTGKKYLFTGSTNLTDTCFKKNNNNSLLLCSNELFELYRTQFEYLLGLKNSHNVKGINKIYIDNILFEIVFETNKNTDKHLINYIIEKINKAKNAIHFMIFSISSNRLCSALINKSNNAIKIEGVVDKSQAENSQEEYLVNYDIACKIDGNNNQVIINDKVHGGKLHHKTMIIDPTSDNAVIITGSANWSNNAEINNDENILFIHSKDIAQIYEKEFDKRWDEGILIKKIKQGDKANYLDVIINEVMWMGSKKDYKKSNYMDEFIELKNMTSKTINLSGWSIKSAGKNKNPIIIENTSIEKYGYLVIKKLKNIDSAFCPVKYSLNKNLSLSNNCINLELVDSYGNTIDYAGDGSPCNKFAGYNGKGKNPLKKSMARKKIIGNGRYKKNWFTSDSQSNINDQFQYRKYNYATPGKDNFK